MTKIVATSDLHGYFPEIEPCDLLLIAGDVCPFRHQDKVIRDHEPPAQMAWLLNDFADWCDEQPAKDVVWIAGNHDFGAQPRYFGEEAEKAFPANVHYLRDESIELQGRKIYGMPWVPNLIDWAFYASDLAWAWLPEDIPSDTDILVIHSPPRGAMLDEGNPQWATPPPLFEEIVDRIRPELVVCGHIHGGYGELHIRDIILANVAHCDDEYRPIQPPKVFNLVGDVKV